MQYFDFFGVKFHFYTNNQPSYQNLFGGIMYLIYLILCILIFIFCLGLLGIYLIEFGSLILILSILLIPTFIYLLLVIIENKIWIEKK